MFCVLARVFLFSFVAGFCVRFSWVFLLWIVKLSLLLPVFGLGFSSYIGFGVSNILFIFMFCKC